MVASAVGREADPELRSRAADALRWLEQQEAPEIVAPPSDPAPTTPYRLYVTDNSGDRVAKSWSAGREASLDEYRTEKDIRARKLEGEALHYLFRKVEGVDAHLPALVRAARSMTHLGWGIDMVVGDAGDSLEGVEGERWLPTPGGRVFLRRPISGTLEALRQKHGQFLTRLEGGLLRPVPPLTVFASTAYMPAQARVSSIFAAFRLLHPITGDSLWLDPTTRARDVAAWTRHAVGQLCEGWPFESPQSFVHGHDLGEASSGPRARFSFLPLPTINPRLQRVESITRVMLVAPVGHERELEWVRPRLAGLELVRDGRAEAVLEPLPEKDWVVHRYVKGGTHWSTVTPVVLPGHDDRSDRKAARLIRKAFTQAGFDPDLIEDVEWCKTGLHAGTEHANRYQAPDKIVGSQFHVRVRFAQEVWGPIAIGSGRFRGMGVFAVNELRAAQERAASSARR
jgi:CRISPR-associated protein Csb2